MKGLIKNLLSILALTVMISSPVWAAVYDIDKSHSSIDFSVSHMMVSTVRGGFSDYSGSITFDPQNDPAVSNAEITIKAASIDTNQPDRDKHLVGSDFLDVENNPLITFKSKSAHKEGDTYLITGDLTIRGTTKEITIPAAINGPVKSPFGKDVIGLTGRTTINRQDFGVSWNKKMDQGGVVVGDEVTLEINIEASKAGQEPEKKQEEQSEKQPQPEQKTPPEQK
jgi:polyisoprenoid-binding protein YceI